MSVLAPDNRSPRHQRRLYAPVALATAAVVGVGALTSNALFTDTENVEANAFTAGTLRLSANPATTALHAENMAPGDVVTAPLTVKNDGSLQLRYAMESTATGPLAAALTLAVKTGVNDCTTAGFAATGTTLYSYGAIGSTAGMPVFGDKAQGPDVGDRTLNPDASETLCAQVTLPGANTGNNFQQTTADVTFRLLAEQTKNNGAATTPPASGGSGSVSQSDLVATLDSDSTSIHLTWPKVSDNQVASLNLYRTTDEGTTWQLVTNIADPATTTYADITTSQGTSYGYALQSVGFDGTLSPLPAHPASNATITTSWHDPDAPSNLTVATTTSQATITWAKSASDWITGYKVLRSADNGQNWTSLTDTLDAEATSYTDQTIAEGASYTYAVVALGQGDTSSVRATVTTQVPYTPPAAVSTITTVDVTPTSVSLSWTASTGPNLTGYKVYRSTNGGTTWDALTTVTDTTYIDAAVTQGATYAYAVQALGSGSTTSTKTGSAAVTVPYAPPAQVGTVLTSNLSPASVTVNWTASGGPNLTGYKVYRSTNGGSTWDALSTLDASATSYTDTAVTQGATYLYSVIATGSGGTTSARTTATSVTVPYQAPAAVTGVTATSTGLGATVAWTASSNASVTGYQVLRNNTVIATVSATTTSYTDTTATAGTLATYGVIALGGGGTKSAQASATQVTVRASLVASGFAEPRAIQAGPDGNLYVADSGASKVYRVDPSTGAKTGFSVPDAPQAAVLGGDGNIYVTTTGGTIYSIAPGGNTTVVATGINYAYGLTYGADGYLYIPRQSTGEVLKVNRTTGAWFAVATGLGSVRAVAFNADSTTMYVSTVDGGTVYAVNPTTGTATTLVSGITKPYGVAFGNDGYLYVSGMSGGVIAKVNVTTGVKTNLATGFASAFGVALNKDGFLYMTDYTSGAVYKVAR